MGYANIQATPYGTFNATSNLDHAAGGPWYCNKDTTGSNCTLALHQRVNAADNDYMALGGSIAARILVGADIAPPGGEATYTWGFKACHTNATSKSTIWTLVGDDIYDDDIPQCPNLSEEIRHKGTLGVYETGTFPLEVVSKWVGNGASNATIYVGGFSLELGSVPTALPSTGPKTGLIAGGIVAGFTALSVMVILAFFLKKRHAGLKRARSDKLRLQQLPSAVEPAKNWVSFPPVDTKRHSLSPSFASSVAQSAPTGRPDSQFNRGSG